MVSKSPALSWNLLCGIDAVVCAARLAAELGAAATIAPPFWKAGRFNAPTSLDLYLSETYDVF